MAREPWVVTDELWELMEPLAARARAPLSLPGAQAPARPASACAGSCSCCTPGSPGRHLPLELGFGSGVTCWRRLEEWQQAGVWDELHAPAAATPARRRRDRLLAGDRRLQPGAGQKGGAKTGPSPVDRGRPGSKHHLLVDAGGPPARRLLTGGNRNDITQLIPLLDAVPPVRGPCRPTAPAPAALLADRGYDHDSYRRQLRRRGIRP